MDVDVSKLLPAELANHLGNPKGEVGLAVGEFMNRVNMKLSEDAYRRLDLQSGDHVLEIGVGNGLFIEQLLKLAPNTRYTAVDISETMLNSAALANPSLVENGRVSLKLASVEDMPLDDASVDCAVTVNCIYFWPDPAKALQEIRRVLRPAGCLIVAAISPETAATSPHFRLEHGFRIYDAEALEKMHRVAGFTSVTVDAYTETVNRFDGSPYPRKYFMLRATAAGAIDRSA
jgi:ubiquinone/menaquinone biosynthesis C-methylase UbiE